MAHWRTMMDERTTLGVWDLAGSDKTATITKVESIKLEGVKALGIKSSRKPVLSFKGTEKKLICGAKICKAISSMYGSDVSKWVDKPITLYPTTDRAQGGEEVECIRVRNKIPTAKPAPIESQPVDKEIQARQLAAASDPNAAQ